MVSGTDDTPGGEVATPTVFRSFLEVAGNRITPSTLSKATLTDLSHTLEDLVLIDDVPGTVLTGFQESQHWQTERLRDEGLAAGNQRSVAVFAQGQLGRATAVRRIKLDRGHPLAQEWFLFVLTERFSAALFGRELPDQDSAEEMNRLFASVWTFDPAVIADLLPTLQDVAASVSNDATTTVRDAVEAFPPRPADPSVQQRFVNAVFERLATTGTVAAAVAHDLNDPLGTIATAATTLPTIDDPEERARPAEIVEPEARRAQRITKDLLTFVSHRDPVRQAVALPPLLHELIEGYGLADDGPLLIEVADVSIEVDPDRLRFTPFVTTKPEGQGTGLGLAIARPHAEDHGGTVTIDRTGPDGTVLVVQLPEVVVNDEPAIRGLPKARLRRDGWDVTSVQGSVEALDAARGVSFDVALLDVGNGGWRLLDQLEEHQPGLRSCSVFLTGSPPLDGLLDGRPVLGKPFAWQDLAALLADISTTDKAASPT